MRKRLKIFPEKCIGCRSCELACSLEKEDQFKPSHSRINVLISQGDTICSPTVCFQCDDAPCAEACPVEAIWRDEESGAVKLREEDCTGCGQCISVCPFGSLFFDHEKAKAKKCDLCGGKPTCVEFCPTRALQYMDEREPFIAKNVRINLFYKSLSDIRMRDLSRH